MQSEMSWKQNKRKSLWTAKTNEKLDYFIRQIEAEDGSVRYAAWVKIYTPNVEYPDLGDLVLDNPLFMVTSADQRFVDFETAQRCCAADMAFRKIEHV